jgi:hypothetical protein
VAEVIFLKAFLNAFFAAIREYLREARIQRDYEAALVENARRDAEALVRAGEDATRGRIRDAEAAMGDDPAPYAMAERMRNRDPNTR